MPESQLLVQPFWVRFHSHSADDEDLLKAFAFLVTKIDDGDRYSGVVWCDDADNAADLSEGWNARVLIRRGGPGANVSWSPFF